jgi:lysophospholipase L1-like esterase
VSGRPSRSRGARFPALKPARRIVVAALLGALALLLVAAGGVGAATPPTHKPVKIIRPPARVKIGRVEVVEAASGRPAILVAVRYPIQAANRRLRLGVRIQMKPGTVPLADGVAHRLGAGPLRRPDTRRSFTFVHEIKLKPRLVRGLEEAWDEGRAPLATVEAQGGIDIDADGKADIDRKGIPRRIVRLPSTDRPSANRAAGAKATPVLCASFPVNQLKPGESLKLTLPTCDRPVAWDISRQTGGAQARLRGDTLTVTASSRPGTEAVTLSHGVAVFKVKRPWTSDAALDPTQAAAAGPVVRAMGDSVTAGFGYYSDGKLMPFLSLYECKPVGTVLDDACSSNSTATKNGLKEVPYTADYGLANNVSWAAQWANLYGVTNYKNYAVSGSEPTNWAPGGNLYPTTQKIEAEDPDYILMTIGANPILANTLLGLGSMRCALESDIFGGYEECVEEAFESVHLRAELKSLYTDLVKKTSATIYLMQYHLSIPSSALTYSVTQIAEMAKMMNETIAAVAKEVSPTRLQVVSPPHFNVGVSLEPVYPSSYTCSYFEYGVDGPSVQSTPTQDELEAAHYLSFCGGPKGGGEPWVISGDTGIHPSAAGYAQMASQVPPPAPGN